MDTCKDCGEPAAWIDRRGEPAFYCNEHVEIDDGVFAICCSPEIEKEIYRAWGINQ